MNKFIFIFQNKNHTYSRDYIYPGKKIVLVGFLSIFLLITQAATTGSLLFNIRVEYSVFLIAIGL
jgi:hypothetical protein